MPHDIPSSLKADHELLRAKLAVAVIAEGRVGEAARALAKLILPHFAKEEAFAFPPLGMLRALAAGEDIADVKYALEMSEELRDELPEMLEDHKAITVALNILVEVSRDEMMPEYVRFAEQVKMHAQFEEEITYPAAILVGEFLHLQRGVK